MANFKELGLLKEQIDNGTTPPPDDKCLSSLKYLYSRRLNRVGFTKLMDVTVCPYCNRNFITSTKEKTFCQFDHFYPQSQYPLLMVAFFNLIPVCPSCNHIKGVKTCTYSPHDPPFDADTLCNFYTIIRGGDITNPNHLEIGMKVHDILRNNVTVLKLDELYQTHTDAVADIYKKRQIYTDDFLSMIRRNNPDLHWSDHEIECLIMGVPLNHSQFGTKPLAKLLSDINRE